MDNFELSFGSDTFVIIASLILANSLFAFVIYINLRGKKQDPHQSSIDRNRQIDTAIKSMVYMSIVVAAFGILAGLLNEYDLDYLEAPMMSLYLQLIIVYSIKTQFKAFNIDEINFDVYKIESPTHSTKED
ncbi:MAG: hypothetical protein HRU38_13675 [Saccharospirillaceae bacterium]|nr:hypothetical protein [Pseudomonadales bacterium]NRB79694.1 hypothetical protein [Saccharospirillaceae bacterium]